MKYQITSQQLRKIVEVAFSEGAWDSERGGMTGNPEWECREVLDPDTLLEIIKEAIKKRKPIKLPPQIEEI